MNDYTPSGIPTVLIMEETLMRNIIVKDGQLIDNYIKEPIGISVLIQITGISRIYLAGEEKHLLNFSIVSTGIKCATIITIDSIIAKSIYYNHGLMNLSVNMVSSQT